MSARAETISVTTCIEWCAERTERSHFVGDAISAVLPTQIAKLAVGTIVCASAGTVGYVYKNQVMRVADRLYRSGLIRSTLVDLSIGWGISQFGLGSVDSFVAFAGVLAVKKLGRYIYSQITKPPAPTPPPVGPQPINITPGSPLHLDAKNCLFELSPERITCHSVGEYLEMSRVSERFRSEHRGQLEFQPVDTVRTFIASPAAMPGKLGVSLDCSGRAKALLELKYGIRDGDVLPDEQLTDEQVKNRCALQETGTLTLDHPAIAGLTSPQLSGWLTDIRRRLAAQR